MMNSNKAKRSVNKQLLAGTHLLNLIQLLWENNFRIAFRYWPRFAFSFCICIVGSIAAFIEFVFYHRKIQRTQLPVAPVFIIGHWRTGTTFMHNLLTCDERFGYLRNEYAMLPNLMFCFRPIVRLFFKIIMPKYRPMDKVELKVKGPQEDELALCNLTNRSAYHCWSFPRKGKDYLYKWCFLDGFTQQDVAGFKKDFLFLLKKTTLANQGRQLILKNPVNTSRVKTLLEMFPDAKFIYTSRNRNEVEKSTFRLHAKTLEVTALQKYDEEAFGEFIPHLYDAMLNRYHEAKGKIKPGNLIEVKYEDVLADPMSVLKTVYAQFDFDTFEKTKPAFLKFLESQKNYKPATYNIEKQ